MSQAAAAAAAATVTRDPVKGGARARTRISVKGERAAQGAPEGPKRGARKCSIRAG